MKNYIFASLAAFAIVTAPAALHAQENEPQEAAPNEPADSHVALARVLTSETMVKSAFEIGMEAGFAGVLKAEPTMLMMDTECPGLIGAMTDAARPIMWPSHQRDYQNYRRDLTKLISREMSPESAANAAEFFGSDLGQRFLMSLMQNISLDASIDALIDDPEGNITGENLAKDNRRSAITGLLALPAEDRKALNAKFAEGDWGQDFIRMQPQANALQLKMANAPLRPEEDAALGEAMERVVTEEYGTCLAGG